jgi:primosomal protein N' (replication factor Y) (superfamily II helicase)
VSGRFVIVGVALDTPLRQLFDYSLPPSAEAIQPGCRVRVPFGRRVLLGVVLECRSQSSVSPDKLRPILEALDAEPVVDAELLKLLKWAATYYHHAVGEVVAAALPVLLRRGAPLLAKQTTWELTDIGRERLMQGLPKRAVRAQALLRFLETRPMATRAELADAGVDNPGLLRKLERQGYLQTVSRTVTRSPTSPDTTLGSGLVLNPQQYHAVEQIRASLGHFVTHLLYGVTGSGKTEVYFNAIARVLERGQQVLVLVPEIALTPQLLARFRQRFTTPLAVLHSGLTDHERLDSWRAARTGEARVIIGTRSAVFSPMHAAGLIIIDEEHDASYKQQDGFRYSARDVAIMRARQLDIPIVLGSATPALETLARARSKSGSLLHLPHRTAAATAPRLGLIDMRSQVAPQGLSNPVIQAIQRHLADARQVLIYLNRRGYAPVLFCTACGWTAHCPHCDAHMTVHRSARNLRCHHCGGQQPVPAACGSCASPLKPVGQGTQRIEETLAGLFPDAPLARIDRDSMRNDAELTSTLGRVEHNEVRILVGTQMLTKGHHFPNVTLVVVLSADQGLFSVDFRASERLAQTIVQVAGRAGRESLPGEVLIQTAYPQHPLLTSLLQQGYDGFAERALAERQATLWPPFARLALLRAEAVDALLPMHFLRAAVGTIPAHMGCGIKILGPAPAPMERRAGRHRAQLLLHAPTHQPLQRLLHAWVPSLGSLELARRVRWSIDVDPIDLF